MRTEEDGNENMEHFVSVGARLAPLPRGWGGVYIYAAYLAFAQLEGKYRRAVCRFVPARLWWKVRLCRLLRVRV